MKNWTGERLESSVFNDVTIEHLHRYALAKELVNGKVVLDIACGEGYGSKFLAEEAAAVTGMDIDEKTITRAKRKYTKSNLKFVLGNAESIPFPDQVFDIVVSFETIEHISYPEKMMLEIKRILKPGGILLISTPNKDFRPTHVQPQNPFHIREYYKQEFLSMLKDCYKNVEIFDQHMVFGSLILSKAETFLSYKGEFEQIEVEDGFNSFYMIAIASNDALPQVSTSLFSGERIWELALKNTWTYRIGNFVLFPFKLFRSFVKRIREI